MNKWNLTKLTSFCTAKEIINKMNRQPMDWEKIFTNNVIFKGKIYRQLIEYNNNNNKRKQSKNTAIFKMDNQ